ncbi:hypothetical protein EJ02DRAFT_333533 [Clathrospora elynae]|uniref:Phosphatidate phosphatase APP1 catalytic domain-containing protein n=1 Tax=Clathrospora elynae TaxID=706981 RepID=A0A6A5T6L2_9PLEO|nr:hypothetical protein EJ02DRAFT_333533 [Clathrospora elynae]
MAPESAVAMAGRARQLMQEDDEDRITRQHADFSAFEADMPKLANRFQFSLKDNFLSYLGRNNPLYTNVNPETDYVWILDNTAHQNYLGRWKAEFVAAYFVKNSGKDLSEVVAWVSEKIGLADDEEAKKTVAQRLQPFTDAILPAHAVEIDLLGTNVRLGPSGRDGISSDELAIPGHDYKDGQVESSKGLNADATPFNITFAKPKGWAVLSDIDDTIKKTLTSSPVGILTTTFAEEPEPIKGMPELYKHMAQKLDTPPFWYLSASPYNLYPFLRQFREQYYPNGTMILRDASWMNLAGFLTSLTQGTEAYKVDRIEKVHGWFPKRKFILIGDSTQSDPEAYGEAYRKYDKWVGAIYIRKVTGVAEMDEEKKNDPERFEKAFKGVPKDIWYVFEDPQELYAKIDALPEIKSHRLVIDLSHLSTYKGNIQGLGDCFREPDPQPLYVLLVLVTGICAYFFFLGTVAVRLWFYKGALGPDPEKFIVLRKDLKSRYRKSTFACDYDEPTISVANKHMTAFPRIASPGVDTAFSTALDPRGFSTLPAINIQKVEDLDDFEDPKLRAFVAEEMRISRLPVWVADDCGDGEYFSDVPVALEPVEDISRPPFSTQIRDSLRLGLKTIERREWLAVDKHYIEYHATRTSLLEKMRSECVHATPDAEDACEELLLEVAASLVEHYPNQFKYQTKDRRRHVPSFGATTTGPLSRTSTFIQTSSPPSDRRRPPLAALLHIRRPVDFFAGDLHNLLPSTLIVRRETTMFHRLPRSGAVIMTTRTAMQELRQLGLKERAELMREVYGWDEDEARFKGRALWVGLVERFFAGKAGFRDDCTVFTEGGDGGEGRG